MRFLAVLTLVAGAFAGCSTPAPPTIALDTQADALRSIRSADASGPFGEAGVELELFSPGSFPVRNEIAVLQIGAQSFLRSRYPDNGDTHFLFFFVNRADFARLADGDRVTLRYGMDLSPGQRWDFGPLDKRRLRP